MYLISVTRSLNWMHVSPQIISEMKKKKKGPTCFGLVLLSQPPKIGPYSPLPFPLALRVHFDMPESQGV